MRFSRALPRGFRPAYRQLGWSGTRAGVRYLSIPLPPPDRNSRDGDGKNVAPAKPNILVRAGRKIKEEAKHFWSGTKLLGVNLKRCTVLLSRVARGETLTRRDKALLETTVADLFRLVPFLVLMLIPFLEFAIPFLIRIFPNMLPSTFQAKDHVHTKRKKETKVRLEVAKFLQRSSERLLTEELSSDVTEETLEKFAERVQKGEYVSNAEIIKLGKVFKDELALSAIGIDDLQGLAKFFGISPYGPKSYLIWQLERKLAKLRADDELISDEGLDKLTVEELASANHARGMKLEGRSRADLEQQLEDWMELSKSDKVPPYLLLMSRSFVLTQDPELVTKARERIKAASGRVLESAKLRDESEVYDEKYLREEDTIITDENEMRTKFLLYDRDADGYIKLNDLRPLMKRLGYVLSNYELKLLLDSVDTNRDGKIDFGEFFSAWLEFVSKRVRRGEIQPADLKLDLINAKVNLDVLADLEDKAPRVYSVDRLADKVAELLEEVDTAIQEEETLEKEQRVEEWNPAKNEQDIFTVNSSSDVRSNVRKEKD